VRTRSFLGKGVRSLDSDMTPKMLSAVLATILLPTALLRRVGFHKTAIDRQVLALYPSHHHPLL
jgi:hypothetical protein